MKEFFKKVWAWIVGHKVVSIVVASVLVVGITCSIVLPIALKHKCEFADEYTTSATHHWHECECGEKSDYAEHVYDNACDTTCNTCGAVRTVSHDYATTWSSDATHHWHECECGEKSDYAEHVYDNACDTTCNTCGAVRTVDPHVYDNVCDTTCNTCGAERTAPHDHATTWSSDATHHWHACTCGDKADKAEHVYDVETVSNDTLKTVATTTAKAVYYKSCVCGKISTADTDTFEHGQILGTLAIEPFTKVYDSTAIANPTAPTNSDGEVVFAWYEGTTLLTGAPVNAGEYKVTATIAETENYTAAYAEETFTITPMSISNIEAEFVYNGSAIQVSDDISTALSLPDDNVTIELTFNSKDVDAYITSYKILVGGVESDNYALNETTCSAEIVKRTIWATDVEFTYNGYSSFTGEESDFAIEFENEAENENVDYSFVEWTFDGVDVESVLTSVVFCDENEGRSNYTIDFAQCTADIVPYVLTWDNTFEKNYDGTSIFTKEYVGANGETVVAKLNLVDSNYEGVVKSGIYTDATAAIEPYQDLFYVEDVATRNYDFNDDYYDSQEFTAEIVGELFACVDTYYSANNVISLLKVDYGTIRPNDVLTIIAPDGTTTTAKVVKIDKSRIEKEYVTIGAESGLYGLTLDEIGDATKLTRGSILVHDTDELPESTQVIYSSITTVPLTSGVGVIADGQACVVKIHGRSINATITFLDGIDSVVERDGSVIRAMIMLESALHTHEGGVFNLFSSGSIGMHLGDGIIEEPVLVNKEQAVGSTTHLSHDRIDAEAGKSVVFKIENTLTSAMNRFSIWGSARLDSVSPNYEIALYTADGTKLEVTFDPEQYTFSYADSSTYELAVGETCYIVLTPENAIERLVLQAY